MIADLKPYPAMKYSGVPWLGEVPRHWEVTTVRRLFRAVTRKDITGDEPKMSMSRYLGLVKSSELGSRSSTKSASLSYSVCHPNDLVMNKYQAHAGLFGCAVERGLITPNYTVFRPSDKANTAYYAVLFRSASYSTAFEIESYGVGDGMAPLYTNVFYRVPVVLPPLPEQAAIVRFLDYMDRRIRRYIRAKQKLIKLLEEQKQVIIHRAVTRGLDPNVRLKPSGVEWLGNVPAHWEVKRLRYLVKGKLTYGANTPAEHTNPDWPRYLRITDFAVDGSLRAETFRSLPPDAARDYLVQSGDLLLARSGATVGKAFLVSPGLGVACHAGYLIRARPRRKLVMPEYLFAFTQSTGFARWKDSTFIIATIQNIGADKYADLPVPVPPVAEQRDIVENLTKQTGKLRAAIEHARHEITLLREFRTRLIADVVTGKLDVRETASLLPDESDEPEPMDEAEKEPADDLTPIPEEAEA